VLKLASRSSALRENGCSVAVGIVVDDGNGLVESVGKHNVQNGTKDFLLVAFHVLVKEKKKSEREMKNREQNHEIPV
jgi:hypothetical protein